MTAERAAPEPGFHGRRIVITGSRRASEMARLIERMGGRPWVVPTVGITVAADSSGEVRTALEALRSGGVRFSVFLTGPCVEALFEAAGNAGAADELARRVAETTVVARSAKPQQVLRRFGVPVHLRPENPRAEEIGRVLAAESPGGVLLVHDGSGTSPLPSMLRAQGRTVWDIVSYRYSSTLTPSGEELLSHLGYSARPPEDGRVQELLAALPTGIVDAITFTSPPAAERLLEAARVHGAEPALYRALSGPVVAAAIGPSTASVLRSRGIPVPVVPDEPRWPELIRALARWWAERNDATSA